MPRAKKTSSGAPGQKVEAFSGQTYGLGKQQEQMQRAMPAPNQTSVVKQPIVNPVQEEVVTSKTAENNAPQQRMSLSELTDQLRGAGGLLRKPDDRPDVPFNATLNDPDAAARLGLAPPRSRTGQIMRDLSAQTGDPVFADLAARAGF